MNTDETCSDEERHVTGWTEGAFYASPPAPPENLGFHHILRKVQSYHSYLFCKLNHGFWERLARLERLGIARSELSSRRDRSLDDLLGIGGSMFAESGLLAELLVGIRSLPPPSSGINFVGSLSPWPNSDSVEGTPYEKREQCESLIRHFVPDAHIRNCIDKGLTGNEFKTAAIKGELKEFIDALKCRKVILVAPRTNMDLFSTANIPALAVIEVDEQRARLQRESIRDRLFEAIEHRQGDERPPLVIGAAGGALTTWLGLRAWGEFPHLQFVDIGGTLAAYSPKKALRARWTQVYRRDLAKALPSMGLDLPEVTALYNGRYGLRDKRLVELTRAAGVPEPESTDALPAPITGMPIPFIENKIYDHRRMAELLSLSIAANHHANSGPVVTLLERMVAQLANLPESRRVVAVCSGTAALHLACGLHAINSRQPPFRWVTSAFTFFSANIGPLAGSTVIDCDAQGRMNLEILKSLHVDSYDGVIYTNVFSQHTNWDEIVAFCEQHGKRMVVDNATGLLDRPVSALRSDAPIEIISAHHTKPWGVGEGGFVICNAESETTIRKLANFAATLPDGAQSSASNYKLSDLAAAAIIDRLERMPWWGQFYRLQERRMHSLMIDAGSNIRPFPGNNKPLSPRAHTPFLCEGLANIDLADGPLTLRKYYRPLLSDRPTPNADSLFASIFSLPNAPEMRLVANDDIVRQVMSMRQPVMGGKGCT